MLPSAPSLSDSIGQPLPRLSYVHLSLLVSPNRFYHIIQNFSRAPSSSAFLKMVLYIFTSSLLFQWLFSINSCTTSITSITQFKLVIKIIYSNSLKFKKYYLTNRNELHYENILNIILWHVSYFHNFTYHGHTLRG